jgi:dUTP diphosphatase
MVQVKIKLQEGAILPKKANQFASGYDCYAHLMPGLIDQDIIRPGENKLISLGFSLEIPEGYEARIRSRSGLAKDGIATIHGTIDCDYRGIVMANVFNHSFKHFSVRDGMRICQMVIQQVPSTELILVDELSETERGNSGFGSTGL